MVSNVSKVSDHDENLIEGVKPGTEFITEPTKTY